MEIEKLELARYVANGLVATTVHFLVLFIGLNVLAFPSAGLVNFFAAIAGISTSFLGSRYFVFRNTSQNIFSQIVKFSGLYAMIAILHGLIMYVFVDRFFLDYRLVFLMATALQVCLSYFVNKFLVFKK